MKKNKYIIKLNDKLTIKDILNFLQKSSKQIVYLVNDKNYLLGSINDGDIRRSLLKGNDLNTKIKNIYYKKTIHLKNNNSSYSDIIKILEKKKISSIPILKNKKLVKVIFLDDLLNKPVKEKENFDVIIMAGGYGKRLLPLTKNTPKCLIQIDKNRKIIDFLLSHLIKYNLNTVHFITYFKGIKIHNYIKKKYNSKLKFFFYKEKKPSGTAGGLSYLRKNKNLSENFIVINSDVISEIDFSSLIKFYKNNKSLFTVVTKLVKQKLSFGSIKNKSEILYNIEEKPTISYFINAGIYVLSKKFLNYIPRSNKKFDMTDLISKIQNKKNKIKIFHSYEDWHDVGTHEKLNELRKKYKNK
tara:strand:- start:227 stop:1294 length:1068 start_codon:yes stop_codon:yes gene_type:complete